MIIFLIVIKPIMGLLDKLWGIFMDCVVDYSKSISELEGKNFEQASFGSRLVQKCCELYNKPLCDYTTENLRIMIGQDIGLVYLVPLALEELLRNPLVSGDMYNGDLLDSILKVKPSFWQEHIEYKNTLISILQNGITRLTERLNNFLEIN